MKRDTTLVVIRKTTDGMNIIPKQVGVMIPGVCVYLMPRIGLASNQVNHAYVLEHNIEL